MVWLFKAVGMISIFLSFSFLGFLKANSLNLRQKQLKKIYCGICDLKQRIRLGTDSTERLIHLCMPNEIISLDTGNVSVKNSALSVEDIALLNEFFSELGMGDIETELERTEIYSELIKGQLSKAEERSLELCKPYRALGMLCGAFFCIFFL